MQVARRWTPPVGPLGRLSSASASRAADSRAGQSLEAQMVESLLTPAPPNILAAIAGRSDVAVIAEVKRSSPSKGAINTALLADDQARHYVAGNAAAVSVLTEPLEFGGSLDDLRIVSALRIPTIRKDFVVDPVQLIEARRAGASAALLIARALPTALLTELVFFARMLGLEPLVEIRDEEELHDALMAGALMIGVNNRDLETLAIDDAVSARLLPLIPITHVAIYESGVREPADVVRAASYGADAVLVGSTLSASPAPADAVRALTGVPKQRRKA
jgi:indole-3-glycerol phosphate synthase